MARTAYGRSTAGACLWPLAARTKLGKHTWDEAMQRPGSTQVGIAKKFFAQYPWSRLEPRPAAAAWSDGQPAGDGIQPWAVGASDELLIVYVPRPRAVRFVKLPPRADYRADLFDPVPASHRPWRNQNRQAWRLELPTASLQA